MSLKTRLQRVLQIVEEAERTGALSDLERDIILAELREAYSEVKFNLDERREMRDESEVVVPVAPVVPEAPQPEVEEEEESEPEMEVEIIFNEEEDEEVENETETTAETPAVEIAPIVEEEPVVEVVPIVEEPIVEEKPIVEAPVAEEPVEVKPVVEATPVAPISQPTPAPTPAPAPQPAKRSPFLSLYEDESPAPVVGEQFREQTSVADTIACPKGVAESAPVASLRGAIGVADKFLLINDLFGGDAEAFEVAINALEAQKSFDDCLIYISENYTWRANAEGTKLIMALLQRRFNE